MSFSTTTSALVEEAPTQLNHIAAYFAVWFCRFDRDARWDLSKRENRRTWRFVYRDRDAFIQETGTGNLDLAMSICVFDHVVSVPVQAV